MLIKKANRDDFVIPSFIREEEAKRLVKIVGETFLKSIYIKNVGSNIDYSCTLFYELGQNDTNFSFEILMKLDNLKLNGQNKGCMLLETIKMFDFAEILYSNFLLYVVKNDPLYYYNSMIEDILKKDGRILFDVLDEEKDELTTIKLVNLGVEIFKDNNQKIKLFNILKEKGFGQETFNKIHFVSYSDSWSGSRVPLLEQKLSYLEELKKIFEEDLDYIELVIYLENIIRYHSDMIEKELEEEF